MWYEKDPSIINAKAIEGIETGIVFDHKYLQPIIPSKRKFKRNFIAEREASFYISGIDHNYYGNTLYLMGDKYYNGQSLDLEYEPWNEYDPNAIVIRMLGCKLGYVGRYDTGDVSWIMDCSKCYWAALDCSCMGFERVNIWYLVELHDTYSLPYQTDIILKAPHSASKYDKYANFFRQNKGHAITFELSEKNDLIALRTDLWSIIGYINDIFILKLCKKDHHVAGFIEDVCCDDNSKSIEVKLRLLMEKSVVNKNYLGAHSALKKFFGSFFDAGTYSIEWTDLLKVVPRKSRTINAYEPLMKYLKESHAIQLTILNAPKEVDKVRCPNEQATKALDAVAVKQISIADKQGNISYANLSKTAKHPIKPSSSLSDFFPLWGITIGKTTWEQAEGKGHKVEIWEKGPSRTMSDGVFDFWDFKGEGIFTSAYISRSSYYLPPKWKSKGFSWNQSYDGWLTVFEDLGYTITIIEKPNVKVFCNRKSLRAYFEALSPDGLLLFALRFGYGEGCLTSSPRTLDSISVTYKGK